MPDNSRDTLYSLVLTLTPTRETSVRATMGHQVHAAFLRAVRRSDPALAQALHAPEVPVRPFTVSPLQGINNARNGYVHLSPEHDYWLRFTILYPPIFEGFMARFLQGQDRPLIQLGKSMLLIKEILTTPASHPWAGYTSWSELAQESRDDKEITLDFVSPTAFSFGKKKWGKHIVVIPEPRLDFGSLARLWNDLAPPPLQVEREALKHYTQDHVVVKRIWRLETQMQLFSRAPQVGFVGRITYGLMADNEAARHQLNALADFAFYSGVGFKRAMGMGQCRRVNNGQ